MASHPVEGQVQVAASSSFLTGLERELAPIIARITAVRNNVTKRGIHYRYILRDEPGNRERVEREFLPLFPSEARETMVTIYYLDDPTWQTLPYTDGDFGIYNPTKQPQSTPVEAYFAFPNTGRTFWLKPDAAIAERWAARLRDIRGISSEPS